jgi:hypothetical protein
MSTFKKCDKAVREMANEILCEFETHRPLLDAKVTIDLLFAYADRNEAGERAADALSKGGVRALGIAKIITLKDRVAGRGDAEITLDGDWWADAKEQQRRALLDHELHHLAVSIKEGCSVYDDAGRPKLKMRKHDYEFGWFTIIAARHGKFSIEVEQSTRIMHEQGEFYFPKALQPA